MESSETDLRGLALEIAGMLWMKPDEARRVCELALVLVDWRNRTDPDQEPDQAGPPPARTTTNVVSLAAR